MLHKSLGQLFSDPHAAPGRLAARARRIIALDRAVKSTLDPALAAHCRVLDFDAHGKLTLAADSPAWATRLRYHTGTLPETLEAATGQRFSEVAVRVSVPAPPPVDTPPRRPAPRMSAETARRLESSAAGIEDPDLAGAMRRLARHGRGDQPA